MDDILQQYCERVLSDIFLSKAYLSLYAKLYELPENNSEIYDEYKNFWDIANSSFLYSGTMLLAKVFDKDRDAITISKILKYSKTNNPSEKVKNKIEIFNKELSKNEKKIKREEY